MACTPTPHLILLEGGTCPGPAPNLPSKLTQHLPLQPHPAKSPKPPAPDAGSLLQPLNPCSQLANWTLGTEKLVSILK